MSLLELWIELMILQTLIGYSFVIANALIGLKNIKDLNNMKGDMIIIKFHRWFGRIEGSLFYALFIQCIYMLFAHMIVNDPNLYRPSSVWAHAWIGGFVASVLVTLKILIA